MSTLAQIQIMVGAVPDGVWGPKSQRALIAAPAEVKRRIQSLLCVPADGVWGPGSQAALQCLIEVPSHDDWIHCEASSFADPADIEQFRRCKQTGKSDVACFAKGDNGIGQFGKVTAQEHTPMVAIHRTFMVQRWGSVLASAHRGVELSIDNGPVIQCTCEDRISAPGRIDCNPAVLRISGRKAPLKAKAKWRWL